MGTRKKILIVDDNATSLKIGQILLRTSYTVYPVISAMKMFEFFEKVLPDLILLDVDMPDMDGYEALKVLKSSSHLCDIPVIFLTAKSDEASELKGFGLGAVDYISKPFSPPLLMKRIENQFLIEQQKATIRDHADDLKKVVERKTAEVLSLQNAILHTIADLVEFRDTFTGGHIIRTQLFTKALIDGLTKKRIYSDEISGWNMEFMLPSVQLHDVGKIAITDRILNKPGKLTQSEFEVMKTHVTIGVDAVKRIISNTEDHAFLRHALNIVGSHHEKWDGSGYPEGRKGTEIPLEGRLMALADVYDALISWRPYKRAFPHSQAKSIIEENVNTHFDPVLVDVFHEIEDEFLEITKKYKIYDDSCDSRT